jgi:hypothetical protein
MAAALAAAGALGPAAPAHAQRGEYVARSYTQTTSSGLAVTGNLSQFRAVARVRVVVPRTWRRLSARSHQLRFEIPGRGCRYRVTFGVGTRLAAPGDPAQRAVELLPGAGPRYVLDSGQRNGSAFRVIREPSSDRVRLRGVRVSVLTRRADIAPAGQEAWSEIGVVATSRSGDECHAGTWRERAGPQIGDALATARTTLRFVRT